MLAVFFVWMECLFMLGYRPALHRRLQNRIGKAVLKFRQQDRKAKAGGGNVSVGSGGAVHEKVPWRG